MKIINILGTGPSLKLYDQSNEEETIGLNKIILTHHVNHLLIADRTIGFPKFVLDKIKNESPFDDFYTYNTIEDQWRPYISKPMKIFKLHNSRKIIDLDSDLISHHITGPYIAVNLAFKLGATVIDLYGCDYRNHPTFNGIFEDKFKKQILEDFQSMQNHLIKKGVSMRCPSFSLLSEILPEIPRSKMNQGFFSSIASLDQE